jgi:glycosyltransferase involved in cell wall biosynthesis
MHKISLVCTVKNEAANIAQLLDSMLAQTLLPDEIVVNDCGSSDNTAAIVESYCALGHPIRLVSGGHNIPSGRNNAIRHASGDIIACTDAGLTLDSQWLAAITAPLIQQQADVVAGFYRAAPQSLFELTLAATNYRDEEEIDPTTFLPFGKSVAFFKHTWQRVGGYPEWASHCEDLIFDLALKDAGFRIVFAPQAIVHFRPRETLAAFARQYYLYARGDGVASLWQKRHLIRYATYLGGALVLLAAIQRPWLIGLHLLGAIAYCATPARRLLRRAPALRPSEVVGGLALIPVIRVIGDGAKMLGYPVGIIRRFRLAALREQIAQYRRGN